LIDIKKEENPRGHKAQKRTDAACSFKALTEDQHPKIACALGYKNNIRVN
jgi:hypothetical protein